MTADQKIINIQYFALLREERGLGKEAIRTTANTLDDLYKELQVKHHFQLSSDLLRVSLNGQFADWSTPLSSDDQVVFIPPVAGG